MLGPLQSLIESVRESPHTIIPWVVLLLPLLGFAVLALFGDWIKRDKEEAGAGILACATVPGSFALSVWSVVALLHLQAGEGGLRFTQPSLGKQGTFAQDLMWIEAGAFRI